MPSNGPTGAAGERRLYLVSCVSQKLARSAVARELYVSPLFRKARAFVEASRSPWFILSAEYGLLAPTAVVSPYEKTLNAMPVAERRAWASRVLHSLEGELAGVTTVAFLAGARYREFLAGPLAKVVRVEIPLEGLTIGRQLQWYDQQRNRV